MAWLLLGGLFLLSKPLPLPLYSLQFNIALLLSQYRTLCNVISTFLVLKYYFYKHLICSESSWYLFKLHSQNGEVLQAFRRAQNLLG